MRIPLIAQDKANHVAYGAAAACIGAAASALLGASPQLAAAAGFACGLAVAIGKELLDLRDRATHNPDVHDALATLAGAAFVCAPLALIS